MSKRDKITTAVEGFFITWALMKVAGMTPGNIMTGVIFVMSCVLLGYIRRRVPSDGRSEAKRKKRTALVLAAVYTVLYTAVDYISLTEGLSSGLFRLLILLVTVCGLMLLFYRLIRLFDTLFAERSLFSREECSDSLTQTEEQQVEVSQRTIAQSTAAVQSEAELQEASTLSKSRVEDKSHLPKQANQKAQSGFWQQVFRLYVNHTMLCTFLLCLLCYLPYFLYQFPGIMTPDSIVQLEQTVGSEPISNHHPIVHTALIGLFFRIGRALTGNDTAAASFYTVFQMCFMAFSAAYFAGTLKRLSVRPLYCLAATLFYALVPYHGVFAVTVWKDVPYAGIVLCFVCALLRVKINNNRSQLTNIKLYSGRYFWNRLLPVPHQRLLRIRALCGDCIVCFIKE